MISTKSKYGIRALLYMALQGNEEKISIKEIAENGYALPSANVHSKDEKFQRIIGMCNAVIMVLKEN